MHQKKESSLTKVKELKFVWLIGEERYYFTFVCQISFCVTFHCDSKVAESDIKTVLVIFITTHFSRNKTKNIPCFTFSISQILRTAPLFLLSFPYYL